MDLQFKIKYFTQIRKRYYASRKKEKTCIINELCKVTGLSRKHAIRSLARGHFVGKKTSGRSKTYSNEAVFHLKKLWHILGHICSKKMVSALPVWIKYYEPDEFTDEIKAEILSMSSPTIDRYLKNYKAQHERKKTNWNTSLEKIL